MLVTKSLFSRIKIFVTFSGFFILLACNKQVAKTKIRFHIHHAYGFQAYLESIPFAGQKREVIDSATIKNGNDVITFIIPEKEERPYKLKIRDSRMDILVINDRPEMTVEADIIKPDEYTLENSPATISVKNFLSGQAKLGTETRNLFARIDSLKSTGSAKNISDSLSKKYDRDLSAFFRQYINYADTVSSPAAFLYIYNNVDFGKDFAGLKNFITKAARRFPNHSQVQKLKNETIDFLKIFEEEYNVGDQLPELKLPDKYGRIFSTLSLKGKYVFMDFWSTWCEPCLQYDEKKELARKNFPASEFEIVSIALDPEKDSWKKYIQNNGYNWTQLIDEKMWQGPTIATYKIDSIPFNFILAPDGKILAKAVKPDSLLSRLRSLIN